MRLNRKEPDNLRSQYKYNYRGKRRSYQWADFLINPSGHLVSTPTLHKHSGPLLAERGTYPLSGSHALQFHLLQVGGSKRHVVINEVRDQRGWSVVF